MDTKLRNYKALLCALSGLAFIYVGLRFMEEICRVAKIYDLDSLCRGILFKEEGIYETSQAYAVLLADLSDHWKQLLFFGALLLVTLLICIWAVGKRVTWFDKLFTEIQVAGFSLSVTGVAFLGVTYYEGFYRNPWMETMLVRTELTKAQLETLRDNWGWGYGYSIDVQPEWLESYAIQGAFAVLLGLCLLFLFSWVKKVKAHCFWHYTLLGRLFMVTRDALGDALRNRKGLQGKIIGILILGAILSATWIGLIAVLVFIIFFVPRQIKKYKAIRDGVAEVKAGNLDKKISTLRPGEKPGELDRLANDINAISEATSIAVANELKNQRMKTELISNVSHDLKTPLTSMVSYVDLLKTEGLDSENALEYLEIIDEKTRRLQKLTEDLFEAAKASSGSIPVNMERIDMHSIVGQALAEVSGRLETANLDVIYTNKTVENAFVMADGQLLWRVMENLLVNAAKYALPGSRVYIDIIESDDQLMLEIKNMSKDRLNIDADELMERFKRGDESRNTEGSGLGLAIAKDLVKLMDGSFAIKVDGDLFKVSVTLNKV